MTENIKKCEGSYGEDFCPLAVDGHCRIDGTNTSKDIPFDCPLRKSPVRFQLSPEILA